MTLIHEFAYHSYGHSPTVRHRHTDNDTLELIQLLSGTGNVLIGNRTYPLSAGNLLFIDASHIHSINPQDDLKYCRNKLIINKSVFIKVLKLVGDLSPLRIFSDNGGNCFIADEIQADKIDAIFRSLNSNLNDSSALAAALQLIQFADASVKEIAPQTDPRISDVMRYINEHYSEPLTIDGIAEKMLLSKYYLCHLFRINTGITVMQYLNEYRLSVARQLLTETSRSIGSIAQDCGFAGSSHFCTVFRSKEGISPREFRKQNTR